MARDQFCLWKLDESKVLIAGGEIAKSGEAFLFDMAAPLNEMWRRVPEFDLPFGFRSVGCAQLTMDL
jgi:hypothetical protein